MKVKAKEELDRIKWEEELKECSFKPEISSGFDPSMFELNKSQ